MQPDRREDQFYIAAGQIWDASGQIVGKARIVEQGRIGNEVASYHSVLI